MAASGCSCWPLLPAPVEWESLPGDEEDAVAPDDEDFGLVRLRGASRSCKGAAVGATAEEIGVGDASFSICVVICARCAVAQLGPSRWLLIICNNNFALRSVRHFAVILEKLKNIPFSLPPSFIVKRLRFPFRSL